jgi:hypothetical protein
VQLPISGYWNIPEAQGKAGTDIASSVKGKQNPLRLVTINDWCFVDVVTGNRYTHL